MSTAQGLGLRPCLVWQLPTLCVTAVVAIGLVLDTTASSAPTSMVVGVTMLVAMVIATGAVPWSRLAHRWQAAIPLLSVVAVALVEVRTVSLMPSVVLVGVVPVLWLVFTFGTAGSILAVLSVAVLASVAYLGDASLPSSSLAWAQFVVVHAVTLGLCLGAHRAAGRLQARRPVVEEQSALLESTLVLAHDRLLLVQAVLDSVDVAIVGYDRDGEVILTNSSALDLAARAGVALTGPGEGGPSDLYAEDRVTTVPDDERVSLRAQRGEDVAPQTYWFGPPQDQVAVMVSARQIYRRPDERLGAVVVGWDVTEIVEAVRVREEFLATVSHELRTPLTSIIGYQELIADELGPREHRIATMLAVAQRNAGLLLARVAQLLQASGAEALRIRIRPVDASTLLHDAVDRHRDFATAAGVRLCTTVESGVSAHLDPDAWEQVVDNLVSNAVKYTPRDGEVEVVLEQSHDTITLNVVDTGIGMSRAEQDRAFERFYRATVARDRAIQGLGVGLAITRQLIEAHGGHVSLSSAPGRGTTVTVRVPRHPVLGAD